MIHPSHRTRALTAPAQQQRLDGRLRSGDAAPTGGAVAAELFAVTTAATP